MPEFLQTTIDKFTFRVAKDRLYTTEGMWLLPVSPPASPADQRVRVGVTDYFQQHNGDVAFVNVKPVATNLANGDELAEVETMKVTIELPSPIAATVTSVNPALAMTPELLNEDPYEKGWLAEVEPRNWEADRIGLLDAPAYLEVIRTQAEEELKS